jgi:hypothetical protein
MLPPPEGPYWCAVNPVPNKSLTAALKSKQMGMKAGIADLLLVWKGRAIALELHAEKGRPSPAQEQFKREWMLAGGVHAYLYSFRDFVLFVDMLDLPMRAGAMAAAEGLAR